MYHKPLLATFLLLATAFAGMPPIVNASHEEVSVTPFVLSTCGQQGIPFSGTASGHGSSQALDITLDGTPLDWSYTSDTGNVWITGFITTGVGSHIIRARIISLIDFSILESDQFAFSVIACATPNTSNDSGGGGSSGGGGNGGEESPEPTPKKPQVKGSTTVAISTADRKAPDFIKNSTVPFVVDRLFAEVFGRKITPAESTYWKGRARRDKATESKLKGAMLWHKERGSTGVKAPSPSKQTPSSLVSRINAIFRSVYDRNPSVSENGYWISRIADKPTELALAGAMLFHKQQGLVH